MKTRNAFRTIICVLCLVMLAALPLSAMAAQAPSPETGSLTILFRHDEKAIADATFRIYRIAEAAEGGYVLTEAFAGYPVSLETLDTEAANALAATLAAYALRDKVTPEAEGTTNKYGSATLENLPIGVYLVVGDKVVQENVLYAPQPYLVAIPTADATGLPVYDVVTEPKYERRELTGEMLERRVLKVWEDTGSEAKRPEEITVQLLRDGEVFDEVKLNAENNWRYTWTELADSYVWQVAEDIDAEHYTVLVEQEGVTFLMTNTRLPEPPAPTNPDPSLPQSGQLWWPVPVLFCTGLLMLGLGLVFAKRRKDRNA